MKFAESREASQSACFDFDCSMCQHAPPLLVIQQLAFPAHPVAVTVVVLAPDSLMVNVKPAMEDRPTACSVNAAAVAAGEHEKMKY